MHWDTCRVNLNVRRICKVSTLAEALNCCSTVATHSVGREEVGVAVTTGGDYHSVCRETLQFACNEVLGDDAACATVNDNHVLHLVTGVEFHLAGINLAHQRTVSTEQQLLTCLSLGIEGTAHLSTTERTVGEHAAILTCERHSLCHTLVDDIVRHLCQTVNICLASTVVTTLDSVVEQTINRVTVVLIVLCCVDTSLCCDRVSTAGRVLNAEVKHIEAHLAKRSGSTGTSQTCTNDDNVEFQFVLGVHQALVCFIISPFLGHWAFWNP